MPAALGVADCRSAAMLIKSALRDLLFCVMWHDKHSADWFAALASPYPAAPDCPLFRGQNKTPRNTLFINGSTVSTGYSAPACEEKVVALATKGGCISSPAGRLYGFPTGESPVVKVLYKTGAFYQLKGAVPPQWNGASYLPRAKALNPSGRRSAGPGQNPGSPGPSGPAAASTLAAKPRQPSGIPVSAESPRKGQ